MQPARASVTVAAAVLFLGLGAPCGASAGLRFRGAAGAGGEAPERVVAVREVEFSLRSALEALLRGGQSSAAARLARIEASVWQTFQALPKNSAGRLAPRAVRYLVHGYFAREHGWLVKGLEPHGMQANMSEVHEVGILRDRAPALVETLLEARQMDRGLSLDDVVVMAAALERLIFGESLKLLETAYALNDLSADSPAAEEELHEVLRSYLLIFQMGVRGNLSDARKHQAIKRKLAQIGGSWPTLVEFEEDAVRNYGFATQHQMNPFASPSYTFEAAAHIVEDLAQAYGKWQNAECRQMKEELIGLDINGDGRVPLSSFYAQPETSDYHFTESRDYLRTIGALDETVSGNPRVRIANYMLGPSNCIASSSYYSVCCLSECEALMNELEEKVRAPTAPADRLLEIVANLTSSSYAPEAPRQLPEDLKGKMRAIGERHGGAVPLHGRLFAQWMHHAYPRECPYPHEGDVNPQTPDEWMKEEVGQEEGSQATEPRSSDARASEAEVRKILGSCATAGADGAPCSAAATSVPHKDLPWSDAEVLLARQPASEEGSSLGPLLAKTLLLLALLAVMYSQSSQQPATKDVMVFEDDLQKPGYQQLKPWKLLLALVVVGGLLEVMGLLDRFSFACTMGVGLLANVALTLATRRAAEAKLKAKILL
uniref:EF-hand domain-containing protein n=1 Tax=Alexandrium catenella TaxID=2925 RepID=A0A7S1M827_ALECA|mmetsp:Transcript_21490/g.58723  ORF Transcript_21490/g.58723 Transcript_21490/m.58723 type:complete len:658 (+) Transcript_21490:94-2067(+)